MSLGRLARRILGRHFAPVGRLYRALFVDLDAVVASLPAPLGTHLLDIGAGDGELAVALLRRFPELTVTLSDVAAEVGGAVPAELLPRVTLMPRTSVSEYRARGGAPADVLLLSDVLHHVERQARPGLLRDIRDLAGRRPARLVIKDLEPGYLRATLGRLSDVYVSGDRTTELVGRAAVVELVRSVFGPVEVLETDLFARDRPNYCLVFAIAGAENPETGVTVPSGALTTSS